MRYRPERGVKLCRGDNAKRASTALVRQRRQRRSMKKRGEENVAKPGSGVLCELQEKKSAVRMRQVRR